MKLCHLDHDWFLFDLLEIKMDRMGGEGMANITSKINLFGMP
jgi:hypothetical protein